MTRQTKIPDIPLKDILARIESLTRRVEMLEEESPRAPTYSQNDPSWQIAGYIIATRKLTRDGHIMSYELALKGIAGIREIAIALKKLEGQ